MLSLAKKTQIIIILIVSILYGCISCTDEDPILEKSDNNFFSILEGDFTFLNSEKNAISKYYVISISSMSISEKYFIYSVQSLLYQEGLSLYTIDSVDDKLKYLELDETYKFEEITIDDLINIYNTSSKRKVVLYDLNMESLNVPFTIASYEKGVLVTDDIKIKIFNPEVIDAKDKTVEDVKKYQRQYKIYVNLQNLNVFKTLDYLSFGLYNNASFINENQLDSILTLNEKTIYEAKYDYHNIIFFQQISRTNNETVNIYQNTHLVTIIDDNINNAWNLEISNKSNQIANCDVQISDNTLLNKYSAINAVYLNNQNIKSVYCNNEATFKKLFIYENILGGFTKTGDDFTYIDNKPVLKITNELRRDNLYELIYILNNSSKDLTSSKAYTVIKKGSNLSDNDFKLFTELLDIDVKIVSPNELMENIKNHDMKIEEKEKINADLSFISDEYKWYNVGKLNTSSITPFDKYTFATTDCGMEYDSLSQNSGAYIENGSLVLKGLNAYTSSPVLSYAFLKQNLQNNKNYLNFDVKVKTSSILSIRTFDLETKKFTKIYSNEFTCKNFQTVSLDLSEYHLTGKVLFIFELENKKSQTDSIMYLDNLEMTSSPLRNMIYDSVPLEKVLNIPLDENTWKKTGNVEFENNHILMKSQGFRFEDYQDSQALVKIRLSSSNKYPLLKIEFESNIETLFRVKIIDENYNPILLTNWESVVGKGSKILDLTNVNNQDIVLVLEQKNSYDTDEIENILTINNIGITYLDEMYLYKVNTIDYFTASAKLINYDGWVISGNTSYGDLTYDPNYGSLRMDGSNNGLFDENNALCQAYKAYDLRNVSNALFTFHARSGGPTNATYLRVKVIDENNNVIIINESNNKGWFLVKGEPWETYEFNLSTYIGTCVKVVIEQTDHGYGIGEIAFIDAISVVSK